MKKIKPALQVISVPKAGRPKKTNGEAKNLDRNTRTFETRFIPRYKKMPDMPPNLPQPVFSESSNKILQERYLLKGGNLEVVETVAERFWHIAYDIASADFDFKSSEKNVHALAESFYEMMVRQEFLPNSPTIMNAGKQNGLQYSACFVLPIGDSIEEIFDSVKYAALIHKSGGGTGFAFSRLRPKDNIVATTGGVASGPVSFLRVFNAATEAIKQGGCFSEDTLIMTHLGLIPIKEIIERKRVWYAVTHSGLQKITAKFDNGRKKLYEVKTKTGFTLKVTMEHKFLTSDKSGNFYLKPLSEFRVGEQLTLLLGNWPEDIPYTPLNTVIPVKSKYSYGRINVNLPKYLDEKLAYLIGAYHADGSKIHDDYSVNGKGLRIAVAKDRSQDLVKLTETIKDIFGCNCTVTNGDGAVYVVNCFSRSINEFLALNGLLKESSVTVTAPYLIFSSPRSVVEAYIAGVFLGDGGNRGGKGGFRLSTVSKIFAQQLQLLLLNLGIASRIMTEDREAKNWRDLYNVTVNGHRFMKKFAAIITPYTEKVNDHPISDRDYAFSWPFNLTKKYLYLSDIQDVTPVGNISTTQKTVLFLQQNINLISEEDRDAIAMLASCVSDQVTSINYLGEENVYDLEVDNTHLLSGNGFYTSNSRRGANMGILRVDHPDILEFIRCKAELDDLSKPVFEGVAPLLPDDNAKAYFKTLLLDKQIANFNISVAITNKFMEALAKGEDYELISPQSGEVVSKLNAQAVFDEIVERAWDTGDPGLIFIDRINDSPANPVPSLETIESTNPCVTGDTLISTKEGLVSMREIVESHSEGGKRYGGNMSLIIDKRTLESTDSGTTFSHAIKFYDVGIRNVFKLVTKSGLELKATANHKALTPLGWVQMEKLKIGDKVLIQSGKGEFGQNYDLPVQINIKDVNFPTRWSKELGQILGWLVGDGWLRTGDENLRVGFTFGEADKEILEYFKKIINHWYGYDIKSVKRARHTYHLSYHSKALVDFFLQLGVKAVKADTKMVPESIFTAPEEVVIGFIQGLFSADGTVRGGNRKTNSDWVALTSKSKKLLQGVQLLLLNLGIKSRIFDRSRKARIGMFPYQVKDGCIRTYNVDGVLYELGIFSASREKFKNEIGFINKLKQIKLEKLNLHAIRKLRNPFLDVVISVEKYGQERVYDLTEPISHSVIANGLIVHQCGEQPLAPWDACNLGSINLGKFVLEDDSDVDWEKLKNVASLAVHFLDNVVQTNPFTLKQIYDQVHKNRRIGLGVMGWADILFKLKIPYNSDQALKLAEKIMQFINDEGHKQSERLAAVRGAFPNWVNSIYADKDSGAFKLRPARNSTITTIAPTGTISIIGDCSSGIEPVFALAYIHRAKAAGDKMRYLTIANKTFTEIAKQQGFYSDDLAQRVMDRGSVSGLDSVPKEWQKVFVTAPEIDPVWHVKMQAAFQRFTDNGVSKTINMPNSAAREDVKNAYLLAWETGCNGITIYRDGSKTTQVLNVSSSLNPSAEDVLTEEQNAPVAERPMILRGRTYKISTPVGEAFITVNRDERDQPFEVFVTVGRGGMHTMADAEAMGRLVSLSLRLARGTKETDPKAVAQKVVGQLKGIGGASYVGFGKNRVMSLADAIAKVLAEDLAQNPQADNIETIPLNLTTSESSYPIQSNTNADLCPECGAASFVMEEGCKKCHSCGYSMC
ncbi:hypothetical protein A3H40_04425 [Candidatus Daviesbacteria bacterium RIFCSPLOWO2_02_FULL_38_15]|uniref:Ribonucleoside-diphosphate reductase n=1 Tax=Candidatus Daviesbacteria bacterium RIFCSPLOWO2_02_FULL_38_15 TaxID=1797794 RepID=A0A1F5N4T0_9BACT|nr:MAG: hypothetical protein A3H40_04425 [Candidatus Daviesbacteria bacterium RIFCSPLOWO2_02_FULL_38_15]